MDFEKFLQVFARDLAKEANPSKPQPLGEAELAEIRADFPMLPAEYFRYMEAIGPGKTRLIDTEFFSRPRPLLDMEEEGGWERPQRFVVVGRQPNGNLVAFSSEGEVSSVWELWRESPVTFTAHHDLFRYLQGEFFRGF